LDFVFTSWNRLIRSDLNQLHRPGFGRWFRRDAEIMERDVSLVAWRLRSGGSIGTEAMNMNQSAHLDERNTPRPRRWIFLFPATLIAAAVWIFGHGEISAGPKSKEVVDFTRCQKQRVPQERHVCSETTVSECREQLGLRPPHLPQCPSHTQRRPVDEEGRTVVSVIPSSEELEVREWIEGKRRWPNTSVQIGGVAYPRQALISQILKAAGQDPSLALAKQVALARLRLSEVGAFADRSVDSRLTSLLEECDLQLGLHPPGSSLRSDARSKTVELYASLVEQNRRSPLVYARE
jgi:hypothetical protein